jgi:hypothetical protein
MREASPESFRGWNRQKIWPRPGGTAEIPLRGKLGVPNFTPAPNQASLRDAARFSYAIQPRKLSGRILS